MKIKKPSQRRSCDIAWKNVLSIFLKEFMAFCWPKLYMLIDWEQGYADEEQEINTLSPKYKVGNKKIDKVFKVYFKSDPQEPISLHFEVQGQKEDDFGIRVSTYGCGLHLKYKRKVISCVILTDPNKNWRPKEVKIGFDQYGFKFTYHLVKILDYQNKIGELEKSKNIFAQVIYIQLKVLKLKPKDYLGKYQTKVMLTKQLLHLKCSDEERLHLHYFLDWLVALPNEYELSYTEEIKNYQEEQNMSYQYLSPTDRIGFYQGMEQGLSQGLFQGKTQGLTQGLTQGIEQALTKKFNIIPELYKAKIAAANNDQLLELINRLVSCDKIEEIFAD